MPDPTAQGGIERLQAAGLCFERSAMTLHDQVEGLSWRPRPRVPIPADLGSVSPAGQEATQDVFLSLYIALQKGRPSATTGLVFRVAHNHGLTCARSRIRCGPSSRRWKPRWHPREKPRAGADRPPETGAAAQRRREPVPAAEKLPVLTCRRSQISGDRPSDRVGTSPSASFCAARSRD